MFTVTLTNEDTTGCDSTTISCKQKMAYFYVFYIARYYTVSYLTIEYNTALSKVRFVHCDIVEP